jgi:hypothetical protein
MGVSVAWSRIGLGAVIGFLIGWWIFGFLGAVLLAVVLMFLMGIIKVR